MNNDEILAQLRAKQETLQKELNDLEKQANEIRNQPDKIEELELIESKITTVHNF
jgi:chaperonin cofactor prefoldin